MVNEINKTENISSLLVGKLYNILIEYLNTKNKENSSIEIYDLINYFKNKHSIFKGPIQNDTTEFFRIFWSDIILGLNEIKEVPNYE